MTGRPPDPERWQRLTELFDQALELDAAGRVALLEHACGNDGELQAQLQRLLDADVECSVLDTAGATSVRVKVDQALCTLEKGSDLVGRHIGVYRIERLLACGGMGRVFFAVRDDGEFEQRVALKLLRPELLDDLARRRFLEERRVLARLQHPHIARLYDGGLGPDGEPWYAMEYVDGASLTQWCDARALSIEARIDLFRKVCEAVDFAHRQLVVHRDLKPGNILVDADGEPKLLDFGIARLLPARNAETRSDSGLMTPEYAAPEQLRGEPAGTAADVYSLGAVLFELLTGQRPFGNPLAPRETPSLSRTCRTADDDTVTRAAARGTTPGQLRSRLRGDLERILRATLDPDPKHRYRSAAAMAEDLHCHQRRRPISLRHDRGYRLAKFVGRHRFGVAISAVAVLALIATSVLALWQMHAAQTQARNAEAVKDFMVDVFSSADPERNPGTGPSARALLDAGAQNMQRQFGDNSEIEADLSRALAESYAGIGAYDKARELAQRALISIVKRKGVGSNAAVAARIDYAEFLQDAGLQRQASQQADIVLRHAEDASEPGVRAHLVRAVADSQLMRDAQAETEARRALALTQSLGANRDGWQASERNDLAQAYLGRGDYNAAQHALHEAAALYTRSSGENAVQTINARTNLIFLLLHTGHVDEALDMYARLVEQERRVFGLGHPAFAETLSEYAYMLWSTGRYAQARDVAPRAQAALAAAVDMSPMQRSDSEMNMAILARVRGDLPGALRILDGIEKTAAPLGADAQRYLFSAHWLHAVIAAERGDTDAITRFDTLRAKAQAMHYPLRFREWMDWPISWLATGQPQRALQRYDELSAQPSNPRTQAAHHAALSLARGIALVQLDRYPEAKVALDDAAAAFAGKPEAGMDAITTRLWQGWLAVRAGHAQSGLPDIEAALTWRRKQLGDDSYLTAEARLAHAEALARLGHHDEAIGEQAQARRVLVAQLLPTNALLQRAQKPLPR